MLGQLTQLNKSVIVVDEHEREVEEKEKELERKKIDLDRREKEVQRKEEVHVSNEENCQTKSRSTKDDELFDHLRNYVAGTCTRSSMSSDENDEDEEEEDLSKYKLMYAFFTH